MLNQSIPALGTNIFSNIGEDVIRVEGDLCGLRKLGTIETVYSLNPTRSVKRTELSTVTIRGTL